MDMLDGQGRQTERRWRAGLLLLIIWTLAVQAAPVSDAPLKAAFVFNFFKFAHWPELSEQSGLQLCLLNLAPDMQAPFNAIAGRYIRNAPIRLRHLQPEEPATGCQLLFIHDRLPITVNSPVLTVGDHRNFVAEGGMIGLFEDQGRLQFDINLERTQQAGIQLSAQLLKLARNLRDLR